MSETEIAANPICLVRHPRYGLRAVRAEEVFTFVAPLVPFLKLRRYVLTPDPEAEPFFWLQSLEEPAICFIVVPYEVVAGTPPEATEALRAQLGLEANEQPEVYVIVSLADDPREATVNLLAPIYLCRRTRYARQVIGEGDERLLRTPLLPPCEPEGVPGE